MQTVTASEAMQAAKPLKEAEVNKGKVWLLLCGGAAGLFVTAVIAENNDKLFPAIARANQAMQEYRQQRDEEARAPDSQQDQPTVIEPTTTIDPIPQELSSSTEDAVLRGIQAARERVSKKDERI
jgi:hypothetical protein